MIVTPSTEDLIESVGNLTAGPYLYQHPMLEEASSGAKTVFYVTFMCMMLFFFMVAALSEKYKPSIGHETSYTIILGIVLSVILWFCTRDGSTLAADFKFSPSFFLDFMLPPLIFNSGYTMHKKKFFQNLGNICVSGLCVTIVCFVIYGVGGVLIVQGNMTMYNYNENISQPIVVTTLQALLFAGLLCSSDVVAAVSIVDYSQQPKLFSCVFGEGVFNDIVAIILYNTVSSMLTSNLNAATPFIIIGQFIMLGVISLSIGVVFGFLTSLAFKHCSFIRVNPITETFLMFAFSIMSYFISNAIVINGVTMSGITSLLTCAIIQSHYTYYNLSPQGKTASTLTVTFMGTAAEAAVYSYVGIALLAQIPSWWSWEFIFAEFFLIVIGRIVAVFLTFGAFRLCCKSRTINLRELTFITYAGMIRGAIAFALVLSLPAQSQSDPSVCSDNQVPVESCFTYQAYEVMVSTTLVLVVLTTLIFGTFMAVVQKFLVSPSDSDREEVEEDRRKESIAQESAIIRRMSHYEEVVHPNEEKDLDQTDYDPDQADEHGNMPGWPHSKFYKWFGQYDENVLRPLLIRNYNRDLVNLEDAYQDLIKTKFDDNEPDLDLAERVDLIKRSTSIAFQQQHNGSMNENSRFMSLAERKKSIVQRTQSYLDPNGEFMVTSLLTKSDNNTAKPPTQRASETKNTMAASSLSKQPQHLTAILEEDDFNLKTSNDFRTREASFSIQKEE